MFLNYQLLIKIFFTIFTVYLSFYFFFVGYRSLNFNKINYVNTVNNISNLSSEINNKYKNIESSRNEEILTKLKKHNDTIEEEIIVKVKKNDTFSKIIKTYLLNNKIKNKIINELSKEYNLKNLKIDQEIYFYKIENILNKIIIPLDFSTDIILEINKEEVFLSKQKIELTKEINSKKFVINESLYKNGKDANIPTIILSESIRLLSFDVDFQRDIKKNDEFEISYEVFYNKKRGSVSYGNIAYIKLDLKNKKFEYFVFLTDEGYIDYFNKEGKNVKKALLKTPIDGARLSSSFGMRKHPILGYNKLHKGLDFAAKIGTPVYAGGNGIVEFAGKNKNYGNYIRIRHNSSYKTAYAHLNNFKKGIYKGARVTQGDIIGYVGTTGSSTGPHLHYEIIYQNKQINPMKMKLPSGKILKDKELIRFKTETKKIYSDYLFNLYE